MENERRVRKGKLIMVSFQPEGYKGYTRRYEIGKVASTRDKEGLNLMYPVYNIIKDTGRNNPRVYFLNKSLGLSNDFVMYCDIAILDVGKKAILKRLSSEGLVEITMEMGCHRDLFDGLKICNLRRELEENRK